LLNETDPIAFAALVVELRDDPTLRGYPDMTAAEAWTAFTAPIEIVDQDRTEPPACEAALRAKLAALGVSVADQDEVVAICSTTVPGGLRLGTPRRFAIWDNRPLGSVDDVAAAMKELGR